jgi:uncharacterized membrane protein HdeD (DUF308 family)
VTSELIAPPERTLNYAFLLGGVAGLIFGVVLLIRQDDALELLMVILGLWWLIQGVFMVFAVFVDSTDVGWKLAIGVLGVAAGFLVLTNPAEGTGFISGTVGVILGLIGLMIGISSIIGSFRGGGFGALVFGIISGLIGALILLNPGLSTSMVISIVGLLLLLDGFAGVYLAIRYK